MNGIEVVAAGGSMASPAAGLGLLPLLVAGALWYAELGSRQRAEGAARGTAMPCASIGCKHILSRCVPEVVGLVCCAALAALFLTWGDSEVPSDPADAEAWNKIKQEWPLLTTADTLIALQAMLRLPLVASATFRLGSACCSGGGEGDGATAAAWGAAPAALALAAGCARVAVLLLSPFHRLDGPLGGRLHVAFELAALPPLLGLARGAVGRRVRSLFPFVTVLAAVGCLSWRHRLALADESPSLDALFTAAELLETAAAAAYLARTLAWLGGPKAAASSLLHVLLPLQQGLTMYYWMVAFQDDPSLVGAGSPLSLLKISSSSQVALYLAAAALHLAHCMEEEHVSV
mmetsp:Transcript_70909/g.184071  ORF Transcript_70909/g.184071 Transcript_70909/m.184071 type:complete len:347 (+) Transcript_70909:90-1130(+)